MNVKTKNPIVIDGVKASPKEYYSNAVGDVDVDYEFLPTEEVTAGDIKVVTKYPIVLDGTDVSPRDYYSNFNWGKKRKDKSIDDLAKSVETGSADEATKRKAKEKGLFWDNAKKNWQSFTQSDAGKLALSQIDAALTARREARYGAGQGGAILPEGDSSVTPQGDQKMSTTAKVLLIGGGLLVVGLIVYSVFAKSGSAVASK